MSRKPFGYCQVYGAGRLPSWPAATPPSDRRGISDLPNAGLGKREQQRTAPHATGACRNGRVSFREQLKSPWYWTGVVAIGVAILLFNLAKADGWPAGIAAALAYCLSLLSMRMSARRRRG